MMNHCVPVFLQPFMSSPVPRIQYALSCYLESQCRRQYSFSFFIPIMNLRTPWANQTNRQLWLVQLQKSPTCRGKQCPFFIEHAEKQFSSCAARTWKDTNANPVLVERVSTLCIYTGTNLLAPESVNLLLGFLRAQSRDIFKYNKVLCVQMFFINI